MNPRALVIKTLAVAALIAASIPAGAEQRHEPEGRHGGGGWHGDIRHFERDDLHRWRDGRWLHARHGDRSGWWWVAAGGWYFYPQPVYPYPDPYIPSVIVVPPAPAASFWYYCDAGNGYYPYVASCPGGWRVIPATPPGAPAQ